MKSTDASWCVRMQAHGHVLGALGSTADGISPPPAGGDSANSAVTAAAAAASHIIALAAAGVTNPNGAAAAAAAAGGRKPSQGNGGAENGQQGPKDVRNGAHPLSTPRQDAAMVSSRSAAQLASSCSEHLEDLMDCVNA